MKAKSDVVVATLATLASGGDAIARIADGRVVFVEGAAPRERVRIAVTHDNRTFCRGRVVEILEPSEARATPVCAHFGECGGCTLQHVEPKAQLASKAHGLRESLSRIGHVDVASVEFAPAWHGSSVGYRTRARFVVAPDGSVGYRARRSKRVVDVETCPVLAPLLDRARAQLRLAIRRRRDVNAAGSRLDLEFLEVSMVASDREVLAALPDSLEDLAPDLVAGGVRVMSTPKDSIDANDSYGTLLLSPIVFSQANACGNRAVLDELSAIVDVTLSSRSAPSVLELFSGSGNLTRVLARAREVTVRAIESDARASDLARRLGLANAEAIAKNVDVALAEIGATEKERIDLVVVNPPREGLSEATVGHVARLGPATLVYVSCDPATFARDVGRLARSGYALTRCRLFDLYPHTAHAEVLGVLCRGGEP